MLYAASPLPLSPTLSSLPLASPPSLLSSLSPLPLPESNMLGLLLPLLVSCLQGSAGGPAHQPPRKTHSLHDHALQRLMQIGPRYPVPFKAVMQGSPQLRQQLESAVRASQAAPSTGPGAARAAHRAAKPQAQQPPSIKLKMDFSNFK